uniref:HAT C-terminal dimerisation domain-containing protein n=1 Tax=Amphimedon queenslandica TaxID=400682 RepID=A0A1X7TD13_AMPQE
MEEGHSNSATAAIERYLAEPLLPFSSGVCYSWWKDNRKRFPHLATLAMKYLSALPTSVPSERLFSSAGDIYTQKRNRLSPDKAEQLLFVKGNFDLINEYYF